jgi:hypothetical protein
LISENNYMQPRGENNEFKEGAAASRETLAQEPAPLSAEVEPLLKKAADESQNLANQADSHDANKLSQVHSAFANSIGGILAGGAPTGATRRGSGKEEEAIGENEAPSSDANAANRSAR